VETLSQRLKRALDGCSFDSFSPNAGSLNSVDGGKAGPARPATGAPSVVFSSPVQRLGPTVRTPEYFLREQRNTGTWGQMGRFPVYGNQANL